MELHDPSKQQTRVVNVSYLHSLSATAVDTLVETYATSYKIKVDKAALLDDLKLARVLEERDGNYSFAYVHYFHYFLARYFKSYLDGPQGTTLRRQLKE